MSGVEIVTRRRRSRRSLRVISTLLSVSATLVAVGFILPSLFGLQRYVITGTSMTGTIGFGSIAFEEVVPVGDLRVGDVITYAPPPAAGVDHMVTHRIVAIHGATYRTKGDAVPQVDPWRFRLDSPDQSRVVFAVPWAGYPFIWLADRGTRMLVIGGRAAVIALLSLREVIDSLRRRPADRGRAPGHRRTSVSVGG